MHQSDNQISSDIKKNVYIKKTKPKKNQTKKQPDMANKWPMHMHSSSAACRRQRAQLSSLKLLKLRAVIESGVAEREEGQIKAPPEVREEWGWDKCCPAGVEWTRDRAAARPGGHGSHCSSRSHLSGGSSGAHPMAPSAASIAHPGRKVPPI